MRSHALIPGDLLRIATLLSLVIRLVRLLLLLLLAAVLVLEDDAKAVLRVDRALRQQPRSDGHFLLAAGAVVAVQTLHAVGDAELRPAIAAAVLLRLPRLRLARLDIGQGVAGRVVQVLLELLVIQLARGEIADVHVADLLEFRADVPVVVVAVGLVGVAVLELLPAVDVALYVLGPVVPALTRTK